MMLLAGLSDARVLLPSREPRADRPGARGPVGDSARRRRCGNAPGSCELARLARTCLTFSPVIALWLLLLVDRNATGPMRPLWENLSNPWSLRAWIAHWKWVDPMSLAIRDGLPLTDREGAPFLVFAPVIWLAVAIGIWGHRQLWARLTTLVMGGQDNDRRLSERGAWYLLAAILLIGGAIGPDSLGETHGHYLPAAHRALGTGRARTDF